MHSLLARLEAPLGRDQDRLGPLSPTHERRDTHSARAQTGMFNESVPPDFFNVIRVCVCAAPADDRRSRSSGAILSLRDRAIPRVHTTVLSLLLSQHAALYIRLPRQGSGEEGTAAETARGSCQVPSSMYQSSTEISILPL